MGGFIDFKRKGVGLGKGNVCGNAFLQNYPPTPPLSQHFALSEK